MSGEIRGRPIRVAMILADEREALAKYDLPEPYFGSSPTTLLAGLSTLDDVEVHILSCIRKPVTVPEKVAKNIFYHAVPVPQWGYLKTLYLPAILRLRRKLRVIQPDVVHGQGTERYYALAAALSGYPSLITIHGNMRAVARALGARPFSFYGLTAFLEKIAVRRSDAVLCLSRYTERQVAGLAQRTWVVHNAAAAPFFQVVPAPKDPPRLLCVGYVCRYKNQNALIEALEPLAAACSFRLVFTGPVTQEEYGRRFRELIATRPWCEYLGNLEAPALREQLSAATAMVHPSLEDNCPMVILEAMAAGLPVIASTCGGIPELVTSDHTGLLCDVQSMASFAEAVGQLLRDPEKARSLGGNGRQRAEAEFRPQGVARRHLEIYRALASGSQPSAPKDE